MHDRRTVLDPRNYRDKPRQGCRNTPIGYTAYHRVYVFLGIIQTLHRVHYSRTDPDWN